MTNTELNNKIKAMREWEEMEKAAHAQAESIRDEIKAFMEEKKTEEYNTGLFIIRWTKVITNRFDSTAFKKVFGKLYQQFTKPVASRRFTISK